MSGLTFLSLHQPGRQRIISARSLDYFPSEYGKLLFFCAGFPVFVFSLGGLAAIQYRCPTR